MRPRISTPVPSLLARVAKLEDLAPLGVDSQLWRQVPGSKTGIVAVDPDPVAGVVLQWATEPFSGGWQVWLREPILPSREPVAALLELCRCAEKESPPTRGWLALTLECGSELEGPAEQAGFVPVEVQIRLPLNPMKVSQRWTIRDAVPEDREAIFALSRSTLLDGLCYPPGIDKTEVERYSESRYPTYSRPFEMEDESSWRLLLEGPDRQFGGYLILELSRDYAHIDDIAIAPEQRGYRGVQALLEASRPRLLEQGFEELRASVAWRNLRSWKPALRMGFRMVSRRWLRRFEL